MLHQFPRPALIPNLLCMLYVNNKLEPISSSNQICSKIHKKDVLTCPPPFDELRIAVDTQFSISSCFQHTTIKVIWDFQQRNAKITKKNCKYSDLCFPMFCSSFVKDGGILSNSPNTSCHCTEYILHSHIHKYDCTIIRQKFNRR